MTDQSSTPERTSPVTALVPLRTRRDGWTPEKQRDFIEHLADTGCVKAAAAAVGMSETSAYRLRRRSDARAFDAAWEAALEKGLQRLTAIAFERAVDGTVKRVWYHGEVVGEERVYSDRLMIWLLSHGKEALGRAAERRKLAEDWDGAMEALAAGPIGRAPLEGFRVWQTPDAKWRINFPPPPHRYAGFEHGIFGQPGYYRSLSPAEEKAVYARQAVEYAPAVDARTRQFAEEEARGAGGEGGPKGWSYTPPG